MQIALCVPLGGTAGIWGPSAMSSAKLAVAELNREAGIGGRGCRLLTVNAADDAPDIEATLIELVQAGDIDAIIGMHTSAVRQRILRAVGGQIPFVYTPLYEGGESTPGVFAIGETTARQLGPAIRWLGARKRPRRWFAIGNDYVWPHVSHRMARGYIAEAGGELVGEMYVPFGTTDFSEALDALRRGRADAVVLSLVGQDAIEFNRAFGAAGLSRAMFRLSCAIGENELLGIGADNAEDLYVACGYFATLDTEANLAFKERYRSHFGERAPTLNTFGQSTYEGMHFLAALLERQRRPAAGHEGLGASPLRYRSARDAAYGADGITHTPIYLARAEGNAFRVITRL
ncbi:nitrile hydratase [Variovorax beijingensis]|uniref:Nitrile hydratase n=1 Tax=Variovorax beijingensis TaxID=2496117 RepID=A0A3P3EKC5_9BURK|nr:nitrile hydratase [Variovorax beijingensis]RSZ29421.1 nitrile hydratase [Variovorax beijingensis]